MIAARVSIRRERARGEVERLSRQLAAQAEPLLMQAAARSVRRLQGYTNTLRPPAYAGGPRRRAHLGGWADVTYELMFSYGWEVQQPRGGARRVVIYNTAEHARYLERRFGFFVIGSTLEPGGLFDQELAAVVAGVPGLRFQQGPARYVEGPVVFQAMGQPGPGPAGRPR